MNVHTVYPLQISLLIKLVHLYQWTAVSLNSCIIVQQYLWTAVCLYSCIIYSSILGQLYHRTAVSLDSCTLVQLYHCTAVSLDSCVIEQLCHRTAESSNSYILGQLCHCTAVSMQCHLRFWTGEYLWVCTDINCLLVIPDRLQIHPYLSDSHSGLFRKIHMQLCKSRKG